MSAAIAAHNLVLRAQTAREIMTPSPLCISEQTPVQQAAAFLLEHAISAAPVVNERGRPIGVISRSDIVRHVREECGAHTLPEYYHRLRLRTDSGEVLGSGFHIEHTDDTTVGEIMMAMVVAVPPEASVARVIELMLAENIHRVFVTDHDGTLIGVISAFDILSRLME